MVEQAAHVHAGPPAGFYRRYGKRALDVTGALLGLALLAPLMAAVALLIRARMGRPVLFCQARPGLHGAPFTLIKFRTMHAALDAQGRPLSDADRLTPLGRRLRAWSLDELPELVNVVRGEMSLVGPRPLLMHYLPRYTPEQMRRHAVRPGITGWAQVHGRNSVSWEDRFARDVWYVDHLSPGLDMRILWQTVWMALRREGISAPGQATMEEFRGGDEHG